MQERPLPVSTLGVLRGDNGREAIAKFVHVNVGLIGDAALKSDMEGAISYRQS